MAPAAGHVAARLISAALLAFASSGAVLGSGTAESRWSGLTITPSEHPLRLAPDRRYLVTKSGKPFLIHGDTAWSLIAQLTRENVLLYLDDRAARGFNTLLVNLIEHRFAVAAPANAYGDPPFQASGRLERPNDAYFDHAHWVLKQAEARGMLVFLTPAYAGTQGGPEGWYKAMAATGTAGLRDYAKYLARRLGDLRNIVWVHGGDYDPPDRTLVASIAQELHALLPASLHTVHGADETEADLFWRDPNWLHLHTVYTYRPVHLATTAQFRRTQRPFLLIESAYENSHGAGAWRVRVQAYQALLTGATGHMFGNNPIWHFSAKEGRRADTWQRALASGGARSMSHLATAFAETPWWTFEPDLTGSFLRQPHIAGGMDRAVAASAPATGHALAYVPKRRTVTLDLSRWAALPLEWRWYDPEHGIWHTATSVDPQRDAKLTLTPPTVTGRRDDDWLLQLRPRS